MRADATAFTRVVVIAPRTRVDVALPSDVPVVDLMPLLLDMVGERSDDGGAAHDGWRLSTVDGSQFDPSRTLRSVDVLDGTTLRLAPTRTESADPVYDDVVDAIAATVRERSDDRPVWELGGAVAGAAAVVVAAVALASGPHTLTSVAMAATVAVAALLGGVTLARGTGSRPVAIALATAGAAPAFAAGWLAVDGMWSGLLLGSVAAFVHAGLAGMLLGTGVVAFSALGTATGIAALAALAGLFLDAPLAPVATGAAALALGAMTFLPRLAVRLARLPLPVVPSTVDDLRDVKLGTDVADVERRAAVGAEYLDGTLIGCAVIAALGAMASASRGTLTGALFAAAVVLALLLRVRSLVGRTPRVALLLLGVASAALGLLAAAVLGGGMTDLAVVLMGLVVVAGVVATAVILPRRRATPMSGRSLDLLEGLVLISILPLAAGAMELYSWARHL